MSEAVGVIFELCEPCFRIFEARVYANGTGSKYKMSDEEIELVNEPFVVRPN